MAITAADARTVDQLLSVIRDGGQPEYLLFWGHQPPLADGVGKGCLSQWYPAAFTVGRCALPFGGALHDGGQGAAVRG